MLTDNQMAQPEKLTVAEQHIQTLGRFLATLREEDNVDVLIETTISYLKEQFDYSLIWIAFYDRLNHILFGKGGITPGGDANFLQQRVVLSPGDLLEQVVIEQRSLGVADLRAEIRAEGWQEVAEKFNIQGTIILPIRHKDRCLGVVLLGSPRWGFSQLGEEKGRLSIVLGELAAVLFHQEMELQHKQAKRIDEPLLRLLGNLQSRNNLEQKLEAVVEATHQFVSPTYTNIYWFEPEGRYFWRRVSNQVIKLGRSAINQQAAGITVQDLSEFYYALGMNQLVSIGEGRSSLKSSFTGKLLQRLQVRSLLASPIIWQNDLLGFLAVENKQPRIWTETDKNFIKGAAGLISLVAPTESMETSIKQIQLDAKLTSEVAQGIYSDYGFGEILHQCAANLLDRLAATRFLLLQYDPDQNYYQILYQSQPHNRRPLTLTLDALNDVDRELLQRATDAVAIENLEEDLRFFNWRPSFLANGVRSFLICNCAQGRVPDALLLISHETNRAWRTAEQELVQIVTQQVGVIVRQWLLQAKTEQQQNILDTFEQSLRILEEVQSSKIESSSKHLEQIIIEQIASVLGCPLALLLSWSPGEDVVQITLGAIANIRFGIVADAVITVESEALIQWGLAADGILLLSVADLPPETRKWFNGSDIGEILVMALRTATDYQPTGVVVMADRSGRQWSEESLNATETLIYQLAWSRRQKQITQVLLSANKELQQLNWYKHRRIEDIQKTVGLLLSQIQDLGIPNSELSHMRYQLLLRQLDNTIASMTEFLKVEQWQLLHRQETMPIATLLKRSLERVEVLLHSQKLWVGVHGLGQQDKADQLLKSYALLPQLSLCVAGDIVKIELILHELLVAACHRSDVGGRIDIWCRRLDEDFLEVSITDNGSIEPQLLAELNQDAPPLDLLAFSTLDEPPGKHLLICQNLMQQLKGELQFYQLPDNRVVSRLLLPLANNS